MKRRQERIGTEDLSAFLDGYLDPEERARIVKAVNRDPHLFAVLQNYTEQTRGLHALYDAILLEPVPRRLHDACDKDGSDT